MKNNRPRNLGLILMGIGLGLLVSGIYGLTRPDEFQSRTKMRSDVRDGYCLERSTSYDSSWIGTEKENLRSKFILSNVVSRLNLNSDWSKKYDNSLKSTGGDAITLLRRWLEVHEIPNTTLMEVRVTSKNPAEAALIANTIVEVYRDWRQERSRRIEEGGLAELGRQLKLTEQKITKSESNLERLRLELNIPSPEPNARFLRTNFPAYVEAKRNLDEEKNIETLFARKIKAEKEYLSSPQNPQVLILERAVPASAPLGHRRLFGATLLIAGLAVFGWGGALALSSRAERTREAQ